MHYKYVDPHAYTIPRQRILGQRLLPGDVSHGFGIQYRLSPEQLLNSFDWLKMHATRIVAAEHETLPPASA
jgi:hypothetical protein